MRVIKCMQMATQTRMWRSPRAMARGWGKTFVLTDAAAAVACCCCLQGTPAAAADDDRQIVALVWRHIEQLLGSPAADACIRQLTDSLPSLHSVPTPELAPLALLHLASSRHMMVTARLLVPDAFQEGSAQPNIDALLSVSGPTSEILSTLIELQLFHLNRARDMTAAMQARIAAKHASSRQQQGPGHSPVTCSSDSSCLDEQDWVQDLE